IHRFARLTAVADVFDALTSPRPYRPGWPVHQALTFIADEGGRSLDPAVVRTFLARVAPYPVGTLVRLNTGEEALVVRLNPIAPARPVVRVWNGEARGTEVDLLTRLEWRIVGPVTDPLPDGEAPGGGALRELDPVAPEPVIQLDEVRQELGQAHELAEEGHVQIGGLLLEQPDQVPPVHQAQKG